LLSGFYDEQLETYSKIPFELVGEGGAENVVLVMSIEHIAVTGRLCNLTLKAPFFTNHFIKVSRYLRILILSLIVFGLLHLR
jgi:hypothetical protein